jgi:hypothetical protein
MTGKFDENQSILLKSSLKNDTGEPYGRANTPAGHTARTEPAGRTSTRNVAWMGRHKSVFHELAGPIPIKVAPLAGAAMFG